MLILYNKKMRQHLQFDPIKFLKEQLQVGSMIHFLLLYFDLLHKVDNDLSNDPTYKDFWLRHC